ncbi:hypothetical protein IMZ31_19875 (plasmid) [Pontibacillus sp. ALD_SL1]|uniref:hypothetical protein n=1 Tax=Pontibacillus sp. ALD_SL1 TaxID=2777185 RepID=UPI001A9616EE|nr:hypothetical protein [Pontibacillus sp. ALD_SL1]QST02811.1 hypothetical protein IMZ31_19875 [Pontibacillus sp. ALD_SL1]
MTNTYPDDETILREYAISMIRGAKKNQARRHVALKYNQPSDTVKFRFESLLESDRHQMTYSYLISEKGEGPDVNDILFLIMKDKIIGTGVKPKAMLEEMAEELSVTEPYIRRIWNQLSEEHPYNGLPYQMMIFHEDCTLDMIGEDLRRKIENRPSE